MIHSNKLDVRPLFCLVELVSLCWPVLESKAMGLIKKLASHDFVQKRMARILILLMVLTVVTGIYLLRGDPNQVRVNAFNKSYKNAERAYERRDFAMALSQYHSFLKLAETLPHRDERVIRAIDHIGRIYISIRHEPMLAVRLLERFVDHPGLNEAENEELHEWIEIARQRVEAKDPPDKITNPGELFRRGKMHFSEALKGEGSRSGKKHFELSESYLLAFIDRFENHGFVPEAYYMLGVIDKNIITQNKWAEHFYLKEAIRKAPHTQTAKKAYELLYKEIHSEYTKDGADQIPASIEKTLLELEPLAKPN